MVIATWRTPAGTRRHHRTAAGAVRRLVAATAVAATAALAPAGAASAAECAGTLLQRLLCTAPAPAPAPATTTTPPVAPSVTTTTLPPVTVAPAPSLPAAPRVVPEAARRLLDLANAERRQAGLGPLAWRDDAAAIAVAHSQRMAAAGDLFHNDAYFTAATRTLLNASALGENVAYNGSVDDAHRRLMASPGHRANLLDRRFSAAGMGVVLAPDGRYFATQNFLQAAAAAPSPRPAATRAAPRRPASTRPAPAAATTTAPTTTPPTTVPLLGDPAPAPVEVVSVLDASPPLAATASQVPSRSPANPALPVAGLAAGTAGIAARAGWALRRRRSS